MSSCLPGKQDGLRRTAQPQLPKLEGMTRDLSNRSVQGRAGNRQAPARRRGYSGLLRVLADEPQGEASLWGAYSSGEFIPNLPKEWSSEDTETPGQSMDSLAVKCLYVPKCPGSTRWGVLAPAHCVLPSQH